MKKIDFLFILIVSLIFLSCKHSTNSLDADVIIYGGTSAAVISAVEVAQSGKSVIIVCPDIHLGGLTSGGLGFTDSGNTGSIGGIAREFYHRVWLYYNDSEVWKWQKQSEYGNKGQGTVAMDGESRTMWIFEPHVAEKILEDFISENNIPVYKDEWLDRESGVEIVNNRIVSMTTLSGKMFKGKMFIDATYEGDLMASAGVSYTVGREPCSQYNEEWNGVQVGIYHHKHYFNIPIDPYVIPGDSSSGLLPYISNETVQPNCTGDNKLQAYCYRLCMSNHPETGCLLKNRWDMTLPIMNFLPEFLNRDGMNGLQNMISFPIGKLIPTTMVLSVPTI